MMEKSERLLFPHHSRDSEDEDTSAMIPETTHHPYMREGRESGVVVVVVLVVVVGAGFVTCQKIRRRVKESC